MEEYLRHLSLIRQLRNFLEIMTVDVEATTDENSAVFRYWRKMELR
jgi:hypothetical protein